MVKFIPLIFSLLFLVSQSKSQELNFFDSQPDEINSFLKKDFKKIEIKIVAPQNDRKEKKVIGLKIIEFLNKTTIKVINVPNDYSSDTTIYRYDHCGKITEIKGQNYNNKYSNFYKDCKLIRRESNEIEIVFASISHDFYFTKYIYNNEGNLKTELIYNTDDTNNTARSVEYTYNKGFKDSINEYYFIDGNKNRNRSTKYFYSSRLDSVHYYNFEFALNDRIQYQYNTKGNLEKIIGGRLGTYEYFYDDKEYPQSISFNFGNTEYLITYWE